MSALPERLRSMERCEYPCGATPEFCACCLLKEAANAVDELLSVLKELSANVECGSALKCELCERARAVIGKVEAS